jgi:transcriptional regulator with XRE-family HTH domain
MSVNVDIQTASFPFMGGGERKTKTGDPVMNTYLQHVLVEWLAQPSAPGEQKRTEAEFARRSGLTKAAINRIKQDAKGAGQQTVEGFARALGLAELTLRQDAQIWYAEEHGMQPPPRLVLDTSTSQAQPHHPQVRHLRGIEPAVERARKRWGRQFDDEDFDRMLSFAGLSLPELLDDTVMFQLLSTARAANAAVKANAIDPEQQKILDEMARLEAEADAAYEAQQKARAVGGEGSTPKPSSATRKKGGR